MQNLTKITRLRTSEEWLKEIDELAERLRLPKRSRGMIIRALVERAHLSFFSTPYYAPVTRCLAFVTASGAVIYWVTQRLGFNQARSDLPCGIWVKPERKHQFEGPTVGPLLDNWLINHFCAYRGETRLGDRVVQDVDRHGVTSKVVSLPFEVEAGEYAVKEMLSCWNNYVQRESANQRDAADDRVDRVDVPINLPMIRLELQVIVDLDVYGDNHEKRQNAAIAFELRNSQLARLSGIDFKAQGISANSYRFGVDVDHKRYEKNLKWLQTCVHALRNTLRQLTTDEEVACSDQEPIVRCQRKREILRSIRLPNDFIFGCLWARIPLQNHVICGTWPMPDEKK